MALTGCGHGAALTSPPCCCCCCGGLDRLRPWRCPHLTTLLLLLLLLLRWPRQVAAMALSPIAALSLAVVQDPTWQDTARDFGHRLRQRLQDTLAQESFAKSAISIDEHITFMEWTYKWFGVDLSYVWDPEMWIMFKQSICSGEPSYFYNKLFERIDYRKCCRLLQPRCHT